MMKPYDVFLVIVLLVLSSFSPVSAQTHPDYYPLPQGAEWTLKGQGTSPDITWKVVGTESISGRDYVKIEDIYDEGENDRQPVIKYARCDGGRIYWLVPPGEEVLMFDLDAVINEWWTETVTHPDGSKGIRTGGIIDWNMTVNTPAGSFDNCIVCNLIETRETDHGITTTPYTFWLAPGVGIVKMTLTINSGLFSIDSWVNDLSEYTLPRE